MTMRSRLIPLWLLAACGTPHSLTDAGPPPGSTVDAAAGAIVPAAPGDVIGAPVTATIDPDGTAITSGDGGLELRFPAGAVATPTAITITPISDTAPLGLPIAWRVEPAGLALGAPAQVIVHLPAEVAHQDDTATLFLASQDAQGYWEAGAAATWDEGTRSAAASSPTTLGDWALTSCVALVSDQDLVLQGAAHLRVVRQCDAPLASGHVGGGVDTTDPVAWSDAGEDGGAGLGTLTPAGATATLAAPPVPPTSGSPVTIVTATVSSSTFSAAGAPAAPPRNLVVDHAVAIASYASWTVDGRTFTAVLGSSVITSQGTSAISLADVNDAATLSIAFDGARQGGYVATDVHGEVGNGTGPGTAYNWHYIQACASTFTELTTRVSVTSANPERHAMYGTFEGTVATRRGPDQTCPSGLMEAPYVEVPLTGAFRLLWDQI